MTKHRKTRRPPTLAAEIAWMVLVTTTLFLLVTYVTPGAYDSWWMLLSIGVFTIAWAELIWGIVSRRWRR